MSRTTRSLQIFLASAPTVAVTSLATSDSWISEPLPALGALFIGAVLSSTNGDATHGVTTIKGQVSMDKAFTVPVDVGTGAGLVNATTNTTPTFLIGGQAFSVIGGASTTVSQHCSMWPWFRFAGVADATNGATTAPRIDVLVLSDINR